MLIPYKSVLVSKDIIKVIAVHMGQQKRRIKASQQNSLLNNRSCFFDLIRFLLTRALLFLTNNCSITSTFRNFLLRKNSFIHTLL